MKIAFVGNFDVDYSSENHHKRSLQALGHEVFTFQEGQVSGDTILDWAKTCELLIYVHTHGWGVSGKPIDVVFQELKQLNIPTVTYHLDLWLGLERQKDLDSDPFYKTIGHFFTVDKLMADWFNNNTDVKGHYLRAGVFADECEHIVPDQYQYPDVQGNDVLFVGSKGYHNEWPWRPQLVDWLANTYQGRFSHWGGDGIRTIRGRELNELYAKSKVIVGDSLVLGFDYPYYWSDRVYETIGRGGFLIMPRIKGLEEEFSEDELATFEFGDFDGLHKQIEFYLANPIYRETMRVKAYNKVINNYTYKHRWATIIEELGL